MNLLALWSVASGKLSLIPLRGGLSQSCDREAVCNARQSPHLETSVTGM